MSDKRKLHELVKVQTGAAAIVLSDGLGQKDLISSFVPTDSAISILKHIQNAVQYSGKQQDRAINCFGVYGSGKSRLAVLIGQMLRDGVHGKEFESLLERLNNINELQFVKNLKATFLSSEDEDAKPYLLVPIYGRSSTTIQSALVENLYKAIENTPGLDASEILIDTEFDVAIFRFDQILTQQPELNKTYFPDLEIGKNYIDPSELRRGLENHEHQAIEFFSSWHKLLTYGTPFDPIAYGSSNANQIFLNATNQLSKKGYKGIAIIWDEFGYAIENMLSEKARSPVREIFELQEFVEKVCTPSTNHVLFIGLTHVSLSEYGHRANADENINSRIETIQGRFSSLRVELNPAELEGYHLLAAQLQSTLTGIELKNKCIYNADKIYQACKKIPLFNHIEDKLPWIINNCYPLHPLTSAALLGLSSRYAASTRTAFHFLSEIEKNGYFENFVISENLFTNELIRLPQLIDFYAEEIKKDGFSDQYRNYQLTMSQLNQIGEDPAKISERKDILSILMLSSLLDSNFQSSDEFLSIALHDEDFNGIRSEILRSELAWLSSASLMWKNETTKLWNIGGAGGTDFETLINGAIEKVPEQTFAEYINEYKNIALELLPMLGEHWFDPSEKGIVRSYSVEILSNNPLAKPKIEKSKSAKVFIVLTNSPAEATIIEQNILSFPEDEVFYWFCFEQLTKIQNEFRLLLALINLLDQTHSDETKMRLLSKYESVRSDILSSLSIFYGREGLSKNITTVYKQGLSTAIPINSWYEFGNYLQCSIGRIYPGELAVRASQKKRNVAGETNHVNSSETEEIVQRILNFDNTSSYRTDLLGYAESSEPAAVVDGTLGASNVFIQKPDGWGIKDISELDPNVKTVVEYVKKELIRIRQNPYRLTDLAEVLTQAPYGIPISALPIYVALSIRCDVNKITWTQGTVNFARNLCNSLLDERIGLRIQDFTQSHLNIAEVLTYSLKDITPQDFPHVITDKHLRARKSLEVLKDYLDTISSITINSARIDKGLKALYDISKSIGRTSHEILEKIAEISDPDKTLVGSDVAPEAKFKVRDTLKDILLSHKIVEEQQKYLAIKHVENLLPNLQEKDNLNEYIDLFGGTDSRDRSISEILKDNISSNVRYERVLSIFLDKPLSQVSELELGMGIGQLQKVIEIKKTNLKTNKLDDQILNTFVEKIHEFAIETLVPIEDITSYLHAAITIMEESKGNE